MAWKRAYFQFKASFPQPGVSFCPSYIIGHAAEYIPKRVLMEKVNVEKD